MPRERDRLPDWFLGGAGKRRLIRAVISAPGRSWTEQELAAAAGLGPKNSAPRHVAVLVQARVLRVRDQTYRLNTRSPLVDPLRRLVSVLDQRLPEAPLPPSRGGTKPST